jgi:transcriptional regulator with XRE-family HTH domain
MARSDDVAAGTELSRSLLALRRAAGLRQMDVVAATGLSQAQLSRIERAQSLPTEEETDQLSRLYQADPRRRAELARLARDARAGIRDSRLVVQRGQTLAMQQRWRRIEGEARVVRSYQPALVLGVLQTAEYASVVLEQPADSDVVQDRIARHRRLLDEEDQQYVLVHTEGALRLRVGSESVMVDQMRRVRDVSMRPNVRLGVIPESRAVDVVAGTAFHLYDDSAVVVGLEVAAATLTDNSDVQHFRQLFDRLSAMAVWGDEARAVVDRIQEGAR